MSSAALQSPPGLAVYKPNVPPVYFTATIATLLLIFSILFQEWMKAELAWSMG